MNANPLVAHFGDQRCWLIANANKAPCDRRGAPLRGWQNSGATYAQARAFVDGDKVRYLGIRVNAAPGLVAVDLDDCLNERGGVIDEIALAILFEWRTYTEITPSGRGLRVYSLLDGTHEPVSVKRKTRFNRELYFNTPRFVVVTCEPYIPEYSWLGTITPKKLDDARALIERDRLYDAEEELALLRELLAELPDPETAQLLREIEAMLESLRVLTRVRAMTPPPNRAKNTGEGLREFMAAQHEGNRNNALFWAACRAFENGMSEPEVVSLLAHDAIAGGQDERAVLATIRSAAKNARRVTA